MESPARPGLCHFQQTPYGCVDFHSRCDRNYARHDQILTFFDSFWVYYCGDAVRVVSLTIAKGYVGQIHANFDLAEHFGIGPLRCCRCVITQNILGGDLARKIRHRPEDSAGDFRGITLRYPRSGHSCRHRMVPKDIRKHLCRGCSAALPLCRPSVR